MFLGAYNTIPPAGVPRWKRTNAVGSLAIDLDTVKDFINRPREDTFWDAEIETFIKVATVEIEKECYLSLTPGEFLVSMPRFEERLRLSKYRPFVEVSQIDYVAPDTGTITTVDSSIYHSLPIEQDCGMVFLGEGQAWPEAAYRHDAIRMTVKAGFGLDTADYDAGYPERPDEVTHALLMTIAAIDMARGDTQASPGANVTVYAMKNSKGGSLIPMEAKALLRNHMFHYLTVA